MKSRSTSKSGGYAPIQTERLVLRPFQPGDLEQLRQIVDALSSRYGSTEQPRAMTAAAAAEHGRSPRTDGTFEFAVIVRRTGRMAGACEILIGPRKTGEIGYMLGPRHWGHGYATEIARALVAFGFDGLSLRSLHAIVSLDNLRSRRVLEKSGFVWDALLQRNRRSTGPVLDAERYIRHFDSPATRACRSAK